MSRDGRRLVLRRLRPDGRVALATMDADGEWITYVRVDTSSDAVLIESLQ